MSDHAKAHPSADDSFRVVRFDDVHEPGTKAIAPPLEAYPTATLGSIAPGLLRSDAASALDALRESNQAVEAITVVRMACERPEYVLTTWRCDALVGDSPANFGRLSIQLAEEFLASFPDPGDGTVGYVFMTSATPAARTT